MANNFEVSWENVKTPTGNIDYYKIDPGKMGNLLRVVSNPSSLDIHWEEADDGKRKKILCTGSNCILCKNGSKVSHRYQLLVLDKHGWTKEEGYSDGEPKVKILDAGASIIKAIQGYALDPDYGDPTKYDIKIKKEGSGKETKYTVIATPNRSSLTKEEQAAIDDAPSIKDSNKLMSEQEILNLNLKILNTSDEQSDSQDMPAGNFEASEDNSDMWKEFQEG